MRPKSAVLFLVASVLFLAGCSDEKFDRAAFLAWEEVYGQICASSKQAGCVYAGESGYQAVSGGGDTSTRSANIRTAAEFVSVKYGLSTFTGLIIAGALNEFAEVAHKRTDFDRRRLIARALNQTDYTGFLDSVDRAFTGDIFDLNSRLLQIASFWNPTVDPSTRQISGALTTVREMAKTLTIRVDAPLLSASEIK